MKRNFYWDSVRNEYIVEDSKGFILGDNCESQHSGDIISRLTNDINTLEGVYSSNLIGIVVLLFNGIGCTVSLFILEWRITILVIILGLISSYINIRFMKPFRVIGDAMQKQYGILVGAIYALYRKQSQSNQNEKL